ncbi:phosphate ABC transporter substrate-binding protein PstS [Micrococcus sp.]|uniref:phosphate ABC transporter substrate-binding protein PstS n=1 Tax=Micrococcus sp. TaxID=1271 RepID=UPI002A917276|nr:phosphate ABC transporter substrate-binding protein PstS [Micrococcus sp.]MDY6056034.1 phosphate ABC transporter substrate-binding protein PstS [Micrococcus sp.]
MKALRFGRSAAVLSVAAIALTACSSAGNNGDNAAGSQGSGSQGTTSEVQGQLRGAGATSQESAMGAWTNGVTSVAPNLQVQYSPDGSGSGREKFLNGAVAFAGSDSAMKSDELEKSKEVCGDQGAFHVPAYISPIAIAYNLPGVDQNIKMDAETIAKVFKGEISAWNDEAIASQNPGVELPDTTITVVHRSDESGTTKNFVSYLSEAAPEAWTYEVAEEWPSDITAESAQGTKGVVGQVSNTEGAITYADASAAKDLGNVDVKVGDEYVALSSEAAAKMVDASEANEDGSVKINRGTSEAGVYPVVLISYHIYCNQYPTQDQADMVKAFAEYVVSADGQTTAHDTAGNAPISDTTREAAMKRIEAISAQG